MTDAGAEEPTTDAPASKGEHRDRVVHVHDPGPMRALAHPLRLRILGLLRVDGPQSVGVLAQATGAASGSVSYHLATLAKHGFVVPAPEFERDGRERWWKAAHEMTTSQSADFLDDPDRREADEAMRRTVLDLYHRELLQALDAELGLEPEWVAASDSSDGGAQLTLEEFRQLNDELEAVREKWWARGREPREGTRGVRWITHTFPRPAS
jgi:DNA-binding transcriptional ArsR family regulator